MMFLRASLTLSSIIRTETDDAGSRLCDIEFIAKYLLRD